MLDTNVCILVMRDAPETLVGRFNRHAAQICISSTTLAELYYGAENSKKIAANLERIEQFVGRLAAVLDFDAAAAHHYGQLRVQVRRQPIGPLDMLIAAHARSRALTVVSDNVGEFARIPGLQIESWIVRR
jgi:tRNA(fMet)-specific endonuclease VapC